MKVKEALYKHCWQYVEQRKLRIQEEIAGTQASANEETKSSAGDKYETGRAMAQLEIERNLQQLNEAEKLQQALQGMDLDRNSDTVIPGSLVTTSNGIFFIAISLGLLTHNQIQYLMISADSPIGKLLLKKKVGESILWNKQELRILSID